MLGRHDWRSCDRLWRVSLVCADSLLATYVYDLRVALRYLLFAHSIRAIMVLAHSIPIAVCCALTIFFTVLRRTCPCLLMSMCGGLEHPWLPTVGRSSLAHLPMPLCRFGPLCPLTLCGLQRLVCLTFQTTPPYGAVAGGGD